MAYPTYYPTRINWENFPKRTTPIDEINLNKMDYALFMIDQLLANWDNSKANTSALNDYISEANAELERLNIVKADRAAFQEDIKSVTYNTSTGVWQFTHQNGHVDVFDQNIEKIPVAFKMSPEGIITMTTADGSEYICDVASILKVYSFIDTPTIDFTTVTDSNGNKVISANIKPNSVTEDMLQPQFLAECKNERAKAQNSAKDSEAWAIGSRDGIPVASGDQTYHNNSKYYAGQSEGYASAADTSAGQALMSADEAEASAIRAEQAATTASDIIGANTVTIDFSTGNLVYSNNAYYTFTINTTTGDLEWEVNP